MSEPFLAEIKIVGFNFAPRGFAQCDGQILPINQHQSLFSLLGTTYGGDGRTTFGLPDLRGRAPVHVGDGVSLGQKDGEETHALTVNEMPQHDHGMGGTDTTANTTNATGALLGPTSGGRRPVIPYGPANNLVGLNAGSIANAGQDQGHENMQPFLVLNYIIALAGLFPSRN